MNLIQSYSPCSHSLLLPQTDYWALKASSTEADFLKWGPLDEIEKRAGVERGWDIIWRGRLVLLLCVCASVCVQGGADVSMAE